MKNLLLTVATFVLMVILSSCESHEKKVDDAFERVKKTKTNIKDTIEIATKSVTTIEKIKVVVKNETVDEWILFKNETEKRIKGSEAQIKELKEQKNMAKNKAKFDKQMTRLEQKNNDLRKRMNDYNEEVKVKWEKFKVGVNHDIDEIRIELKDVSINK